MVCDSGGDCAGRMMSKSPWAGRAKQREPSGFLISREFWETKMGRAGGTSAQTL